jgi:hypothetical protein
MSAYAMPQPGPEHEVLRRMTGDWTCEETMHPSAWSPETKTAEGRSSTRMLDGLFAITDYEQLKAGKVTFRGHGIHGWDPKANEYVMYWVDSMGGAGGVARGTYADDVLTFRNRSPMGHNRYRYTFVGEEMHFQIATSKDGETWQAMMDSVFRPA